MYISIYIDMYMYVYLCIYTCIHIHIYIHMYTPTRIHTQRPLRTMIIKLDQSQTLFVFILAFCLSFELVHSTSDI